MSRSNDAPSAFGSALDSHSLDRISSLEDTQQSSAYSHYCNILNELSDMIDNEYDQWQLTVINHYRNDDVMDNLIKEVQRYTNILSSLFDVISVCECSISIDEKDDLLTSIAEISDKCETAICYPDD